MCIVRDGIEKIVPTSTLVGAWRGDREPGRFEMPAHHFQVVSGILGGLLELTNSIT